MIRPGRILGLVAVIIVLVLAPTIDVANNEISDKLAECANGGDMVGMSILLNFGAPIIILACLLTGGMLAVGRVNGVKPERYFLMAIASPVMAVIVLKLYASLCLGNTDILLSSSEGAWQTFFSLLPALVYLYAISVCWELPSLTLYRGKKKKKAAMM